MLVVDPDATARADTVDVVESALPGATVREAGSLADAEAALDPETDTVVTEYDLGDGTGLELITTVRASVPDAGCVLYTAATEIDTDSFEEVIAEFVPKGGEDDQLAMALEATAVDHSQTAYPLPDDEAGRLAAIERYVEGATDDGVRRALDRLADLAARHFGVEVASINLIREHEQDFLAARGRDWQPIPRADSICTYTILHDRTMAVEDVAEDPRFADNDLLAEQGIRAYLGATIHSPDGHSIGTLCVYDGTPRAFSATEEAFIMTLADLAMDIIALGGDRREAPGGDGA